MPSTLAASSSVPPETPRAFARRADGFRHAIAGGLWLGPLVYPQRARLGPRGDGKGASSPPQRPLPRAVGKAIPPRAPPGQALPHADIARPGPPPPPRG